MVLDSLFQLDLLEWGIGLGGFKKFLLPPKSSVILCWWTFFCPFNGASARSVIK